MVSNLNHIITYITLLYWIVHNIIHNITHGTVIYRNIDDDALTIKYSR